MRPTTSAAAGPTALLLSAAVAAVAAAAPQYNIVKLAPPLGTLTAVGSGEGISPGGFATGFAQNSGTGGSASAFLRAPDGSVTQLPNLVTTGPTRPFNNGRGANDLGTVVGTAGSTATLASPLPVIWKGGSVAALPLPAGQTSGRANAVNGSDVAVGSVGGGVVEFATTFTPTAATILTQTLNGGVLRTATGINDAGRIVGTATDPTNAAVTKGYYLDPGDASATDLGALPGRNSALPSAVSSNGLVAGSSTQNGASGLPFLWSEAGGMVAVPLPAGATMGGARGVNDDGWVVGTASGAFALPYLYDGTATHLLSDLIPASSGWNLSTNTSSLAAGIADDGTIVGRGVFNGTISAFVMTPVVPEPTTLGAGLIAAAALVRRRR